MHRLKDYLLIFQSSTTTAHCLPASDIPYGNFKSFHTIPQSSFNSWWSLTYIVRLIGWLCIYAPITTIYPMWKFKKCPWMIAYVGHWILPLQHQIFFSFHFISITVRKLRAFILLTSFSSTFTSYIACNDIVLADVSISFSLFWLRHLPNFSISHLWALYLISMAADIQSCFE